MMFQKALQIFKRFKEAPKIFCTKCEIALAKLQKTSQIFDEEHKEALRDFPMILRNNTKFQFNLSIKKL